MNTLSINWISDYILSILAISLTLVLTFHYVFEKAITKRLSKKYRDSIFETQSELYLKALSELVKGSRDLAIKELSKAVEINSDSIDAYFILGNLYRLNGEYEKAIDLHSSLIVRENILETYRVKALVELAKDYDKSGILDRAISAYLDVLKVNRDQIDVLYSLCRIYEDIEEWDNAIFHRLQISKLIPHNHGETISQLLIQKAKQYFDRGDLKTSKESTDEAYKYAPTVSAKMMSIKLLLIQDKMVVAKNLLLDFIKEHPFYSSFLFINLSEPLSKVFLPEVIAKYQINLSELKLFFLDFSKDISSNSEEPSLVLTKVRLLKEEKNFQLAHDLLVEWMTLHPHNSSSEALRIEHLKILVELGQTNEVLIKTQSLLETFHHSLARHFCGQCGFNTDSIFWRCPQCREWESIQFRWKI